METTHKFKGKINTDTMRSVTSRHNAIHRGTKGGLGSRRPWLKVILGPDLGSGK